MRIPFLSKKKPTKEQLLADLSNTTYDAFVSYKHGDIDSAVAEKLQELLEHFPIPASTDEKRKIQRVFVDTGELSSSSDFVQQVETALKNAKWLIVVCSPGSRNSEWCKLEVETFLKYHDVHHILLLMTEGEPDDIFPEKLMEQEKSAIHILAADARGRNKQEVLKKLKTQAIYKIAAPILGTSYDSLRQRKKTYMFQRIAVAAGIILVVLAGFTSYIIWQAIQVKEQYRQALRNQARFMTTVSKQLFESGDRDKALLADLAIAPEDPAEGPVVLEQLYPLTQALACYEGGAHMNPVKAVDLGNYKQTELSESKERIYVRYSDKLRVLSLADGSDQWEFTLEEITRWLAQAGKKNWQEESAILNMDCGNGDLIFLTLPDYIMALDVEQHQILYTIDCLEPSGGSTSPYSYIKARNNVLVQIDKYAGEVCLYNQTTGSLLKTIDLSQWLDPEVYYTLNTFDLSEDGNEITLAFQYDWREEGYTGITLDTKAIYRHIRLARKYFKTHPPIGLARLDLEEDKLTVLSETPAQSTSYYEGKRIAAVFQDIWENNQEIAEYGLDLSDQSLGLYDEKNQEIFRYDLGRTASDKWINSGFAVGEIIYHEETIPAFSFWKGEKLWVINYNTNKILARMEFHSPVVDVQFPEAANEGFIVCLKSGRVLETILDDEHFYRLTLCNLSTEATALYRDLSRERLVIAGDYKLIFCEAIVDPNYQVLAESGPKEAERKSVSYVNLGEESYRIIHYLMDSYDIGFAVYSCQDQSCLYQWQMKSEDMADKSHIDSIRLVKNGEDLLVYWVEIKVTKEDTGYGYPTDNRAWVLHCYNISQGQEVFHQNLNEAMAESGKRLYTYFSSKEMAFDKDMKAMACINDHDYDEDQAGFSMFALTDQGLEARGQVLFPELELDFLQWSGDQKHILMSGTNMEQDDQREYWVYHLPKNWQENMDFSDWKENSQRVMIPQEYATDFNVKYLILNVDLRLVPGQTGSLMLIQTNNNHNFLLDLAAPDQMITDNLGGKINAGFFRDDQYLIFMREEIIYLYEIKSHRIIRQYMMSQWDESLSDSGKIITDGNPDFFALDYMGSFWYDPGTDEGIINAPAYIFYVGDDLDIYLYASSTNLVMNLQGEEISQTRSGEVLYTSLYSYATLAEQAREILGDQELGEEEKQEYFLGE